MTVADERREASLFPIPGGDVRLIAYSVALCTGTGGVILLGVLWLIPEAERSHMVVALATGVAASLPSWLAYLKSHANGNAAEEIKEKAETAAEKANQAVRTAAETRQEIRINTELTAETNKTVRQAVGADGAAGAPGRVETFGPRPYPPAAEGDEPGD